MDATKQSLETLQDIKRMMERSSRFISLSGWSGIAAGICALGGAWFAHAKINAFYFQNGPVNGEARGKYISRDGSIALGRELLFIAAIVFIAAFISAFIFTYVRSRKTGMAIWGVTAQRLLWNTVIPMATGGFVILRLLELGYYLLVAPCCLIFYGLALVNGSKYTLGEVKYLGFGQIILGIINLWMVGYGLFFWAAGFGVLHILYGGMMWWKYERTVV